MLNRVIASPEQVLPYTVEQQQQQQSMPPPMSTANPSHMRYPVQKPPTPPSSADARRSMTPTTATAEPTTSPQAPPSKPMMPVPSPSPLESQRVSALLELNRVLLQEVIALQTSGKAGTPAPAPSPPQSGTKTDGDAAQKVPLAGKVNFSKEYIEFVFPPGFPHLIPSSRVFSGPNAVHVRPRQIYASSASQPYLLGRHRGAAHETAKCVALSHHHGMSAGERERGRKGDVAGDVRSIAGAMAGLQGKVRMLTISIGVSECLGVSRFYQHNAEKTRQHGMYVYSARFRIKKDYFFLLYYNRFQ